MKKIIAGLLAFTLTACTFAGCQKNISANKTDDVTEEKAEAEELSEDGDYKTALKEFADAYAENDRQKTLLMQNPKDIMVLVRALVREEGQTEDDIINTMQSDLYETVNSGEKFTFKRIVSAEPLGEDDMEDLKYTFGGRKCAIDYIIRNGGAEKVDLGSLADAIGEIEAETEIYEAGIEEAYYVIYEAENADGDTEEKTVIMFHVKDDGWKISADDVIGTFLNGADKRLNDAAESLYKAVNTALIELVEEGYIKNDSDAFIVSSDSSKDFNVPADFDADLFRSHIKNYFEYEGDWFVKIQGAYALETAVYDSENPHNVDTYPLSDYVDFAYEGMSYDEIYNKACEDIG